MSRIPSVVVAVRGEIRLLELQRSALAATALALAKQLDDSETSATSKSMCAKVLVETLDRMRAASGARRDPDRIDELGERRQTRRKAASG